MPSKSLGKVKLKTDT